MAKGDIPKTAVITPFGLFEFEAVPLKSTTVEECARVILRSWIPLFGVPSVITSDQGAQFTSSVWSALCRFLGIVHSPTTSFHPQSNGIVERFHRQLKVSLRGRLAGTDWFHHLPLVLLGLICLRLWSSFWFSVGFTRRVSKHSRAALIGVSQENPVYPEEQCISPASPLCSSSLKTRSDPFKFGFLFSCFYQRGCIKTAVISVI